MKKVHHHNPDKPGPEESQKPAKMAPSAFTVQMKRILSERLVKTRERIKKTDYLKHRASLLSALSTQLNLEEYSFEDDKPYLLDPKGKNQEAALDVTALDRYNEDIRYYRNVILQECRRFPKKAAISGRQLQVIATAISRLCRTAYYGTHKARMLASEIIPLLVWILNEDDLPYGLHVIVLRSIGELLYDSLELKKQFVEQNGVKVLCHLMINIPCNLNLSQIAVYVLAMAAIGCAEIIIEARKQRDIEEVVGEMAFEYYWIDWPVNFGIILQGLLFGPNSISPIVELFQFV
ncbi:unnamed protein product [Allacma fusca]|uniref:Uncharacterized protein n=1 Tax=Allacma fusca TaxID=39272 RepID=A0A8J2J3H4_9HEXA|nr:unnamed protein product [Allacma fusca]